MRFKKVLVGALAAALAAVSVPLDIVAEETDGDFTYEVLSDGTLENMNAVVENGYVYFATTHFST